MAEIARLGKYRLEEHLGGGAFADVYRAVDEAFQRTVALKILKPQFLSSVASTCAILPLP